MHDRSEWTKLADGPKTIGKKTYSNLTEFARPCVTCGKPFSIFVTKKIASGHSDSNSFALKNCPEHRRNKTSGDVFSNTVLQQTCADQEKQIAELVSENELLKARLAKYELPAALQAVAAENKMPWDG